MVRIVVTCVLLCSLAACGGGSTGRFSADPRQYLLTIDEMVSSDFTVSMAPALTDATTASVSFARSVDFGTSNGPIAVIDAVQRFASTDAAHSSFAADASRLDAEKGEVVTSTGALGDEAHADSLVMTAPDGIQAVQITLEWRVSNVVVTLIVRGRYGGTRLDDALELAHRQTSTQLA
ncbi:MAG: hypothetical protein JOY80_11765 [Candidatus Dormibacteraeota bacterium]|nr:hypothetical protein [Candidatus Dormibacteraeota bacterium]